MPHFTCPTCNAPLPDGAMENPITTALAVTAAALMNHVPSRARLEVVQHMINERKERNHERRVEVSDEAERGEGQAHCPTGARNGFRDGTVHRATEPDGPPGCSHE